MNNAAPTPSNLVVESPTGSPSVNMNEHGQPIGDPVTWAPARFPVPVTLTGRTCVVEPLRAEHAPALFEAFTQAAGDDQWTYLPFGPCRDAAAMTRVVTAMLDDPTALAFVVLDADGRPCGMASYLRIQPGVGSIEVGAIMYGAGLRRSVAGTEAMYLLARHAVDDLGYRRYEWKCDALNAPSRAAALRLGFGFEGIWRNATIYKGRNRDTAWYALTDTDWQRLRPAYEAWLDPANHDAHGQRTSLADQIAAHR